jgi:NAD(P)-dependent dehydrogenase (short-subunit alcohol dehydrogenase family)
MKSLRVLVTGGTSGIGKAIVERLTSEGSAVAFTGRNAERGREVADATDAVFLQADLVDPTSGDESTARAVEALGGLDALVHNAGIDHEGPLSETTDEAWDALVETNLLAAARQATAALRHLRESSNGSICIISSDAAVWPEVSVAAYSAVKRAVTVLGQMLAVQNGPARIRVNVVCPGDIAPGMRSTASGYSATGAVDEWLVPPIGRVGEARDVAGIVSFLLSPAAAFCTGATFLVDGGMRASTTAVDR